MSAVSRAATTADPQRLAAEPGASVFVTANAGSGKTSTLVSRVARLLLAGSPPETLLCVTYTKAAAAEMQRRLFARLGAWAVMDDRALTGELLDIGEPPEALTPARLSQARTLFARALETPGGLKIQTLHAFCEKLLRRFPLEAGVSPGFQVLEDAAAAEVSRRARDAVALQALDGPEGAIGEAYARLAVELDLRSFEGLFAALEGSRGALARYAETCAARGLTIAEDVWRVCGFADAPVDPEALERAAVQGCEWAAWRRAAAALVATGAASDIALGDKLAALAECAEAGPPFADCLALFSTAAGEPSRRLGTKGLDPAARDWLLAEQARLHAVCRRARAARMARDTVAALTLGVAYAAVYDREKAATGRLDFADLIARTGALLTRREDAAWVLYKLDGGVDHVLVDEAQDTSPEQWAILRALTAEFFAGAGVRPRTRTVFGVGDEKQSIFSFQGARPERLQLEADHYAAQAAQAGGRFARVPLVRSWRSTPEVLRFVDAVFADPDTRAAVPPAVGDEAVRHTAGRTDGPGCVDLWPPVRDEPAEAPEAWDAPVDAPAPDSARKRLARRIAAEVRGLWTRGDRVFDPGAKAWRAAGPGDVLVLVRRRDALFEEIIRALKRVGVPVAGVDRLRLSEHIAFQDLVALCRFALFPTDDLTLAEVLRSPFCDLDEDSLYDLAQPRAGRLWPELVARADERPAWASARAFLGWAREEGARRTPFDFLGRVLSRLDADGRSMRQRLLTRLGGEAQDALDEMLGQALAAESRGIFDLERFTAAMDAADLEVKRELEAPRGEVRVMTVHAAKGLEAPIVVLPDTTARLPAIRGALLRTPEGGFLFAPRKGEDCPASAAARQAIIDQADAEALRLLYVALTRARDRLIVCGRLSTRDKVAPEGSWYQRVAAAFDHPGVVDETRWIGEGEAAVRRFGPDPVTGPAAPAAPADQAAPPAWLTGLAPAEAGVAALSPSRLDEGSPGAATSPLAFDAAAGRPALGRFRRGAIIHRLLQLLPDLPAEARADGARRLLDKEAGLDALQRAEMADAALGVLRDPAFGEVFGPGSRAEAAIAGTAPALPAGMRVSGRVDRMVVTPGRVLVLDFKTNRPAPARVEDADPAYLTQMAVYAAVLGAVFPERRVEAALVWTDGPRLMPLAEGLIVQRLAALRRET